MVWGATLGNYGAGKSIVLFCTRIFRSLAFDISLGLHIFWDAKWGTFNSERFIYYAIPLLKNDMHKYPGCKSASERYPWRNSVGSMTVSRTSKGPLYQGIHQVRTGLGDRFTNSPEVHGSGYCYIPARAAHGRFPSNLCPAVSQ
jgi:hypothetical protein